MADEFLFITRNLDSSLILIPSAHWFLHIQYVSQFLMSHRSRAVLANSGCPCSAKNSRALVVRSWKTEAPNTHYFFPLGEDVRLSQTACGPFWWAFHFPDYIIPPDTKTLASQYLCLGGVDIQMIDDSWNSCFLKLWTAIKRGGNILDSRFYGFVTNELSRAQFIHVVLLTEMLSTESPVILRPQVVRILSTFLKRFMISAVRLPTGDRETTSLSWPAPDLFNCCWSSFMTIKLSLVILNA